MYKQNDNPSTGKGAQVMLQNALIDWDPCSNYSISTGAYQKKK